MSVTITGIEPKHNPSRVDAGYMGVTFRYTLAKDPKQREQDQESLTEALDEINQAIADIFEKRGFYSKAR